MSSTVMPKLDGEAAARDWLTTQFAPTPEMWARLDRFASLLVAENSRQNLIAASTVPHFWVRHIVDSAQLLAFDERGGDGLWLDLGSGPGLPGMVIAILSERPIWLVESRKRRCTFLSETAAALGVGSQVRVVESRLERLPSHPMATISARAFAPLDKLMGLSARFSTKSTRWLLPKGQNAVKELALLPASWQTLFHVEQSVTDPDSAILVGRGVVPGQKRGKK